MDPFTASALISGGSALLGGFLDRKAQKSANKQNSPKAQVAAWEAAGINPHFGISQGQYIPVQAASMGDAFAQAGGQFARSIENNHAEALANSELEQENQKLKEALDSASKVSPPSHMSSTGIEIPDGRMINTDMGVLPEALVRAPTPITDDGRIDTSIDDGGTGTTVMQRERIVLDDGKTRDVTIGPEWDELLSGVMFETEDFVKTMRRNQNRLRDNSYGGSPHELGAPTPWPYELGAKPKGFDQGNHYERQAMISRRTGGQLPYQEEPPRTLDPDTWGERYNPRGN